MADEQRSIADIEAELSSIDSAAHAQALDEAQTTGGEKPSGGRDYEYEASRKGWKPESEYQGTPGKWVDAKTFIERGDRFTGKLESEIARLQAQVAAFDGTKKQMKTFFERELVKQQKEHSDAINALRLQRSQAIRDGDDELSLELEDRIEATRKQAAALATETKELEAGATPAAAATITLPQDNAVLNEWIEDGNDWIRNDETLREHAITVGKQLRSNGEKAIGRKFLEIVAEQVRSDFPRRFKALAATGEKPVSTGSGSNRNANTPSDGYQGKTERDLPPEDLAIMRQFVKEKLYTKEEFLKSYFSRNK
jgi:hypothetical protein